MSQQLGEALLLPEEVAEHLRISVAKVLDLRRQGDIEGTDVSAGRKPVWRFTPTQVAAFKRARKVRGR